jgi:hypothetical protein
VFVPRHIELLGGKPDRPYDAIGRIEARGRPGDRRSYARQELRNKARALGADAVIFVEEHPGVLRKTQPGAFPHYGFDVQTGGVRYELRGLAVRYTDRASQVP